MNTVPPTMKEACATRSAVQSSEKLVGIGMKKCLDRGSSNSGHGMRPTNQDDEVFQVWLAVSLFRAIEIIEEARCDVAAEAAHTRMLGVRVGHVFS